MINLLNKCLAVSLATLIVVLLCAHTALKHDGLQATLTLGTPRVHVVYVPVQDAAMNELIRANALQISQVSLGQKVSSR